MTMSFLWLVVCFQDSLPTAAQGSLYPSSGSQERMVTAFDEQINRENDEEDLSPESVSSADFHSFGGANQDEEGYALASLSRENSRDLARAAYRDTPDLGRDTPSGDSGVSGTFHGEERPFARPAVSEPSLLLDRGQSWPIDSQRQHQPPPARHHVTQASFGASRTPELEPTDRSYSATSAGKHNLHMASAAPGTAERGDGLSLSHAPSKTRAPSPAQTEMPPTTAAQRMEQSDSQFFFTRELASPRDDVYRSPEQLPSPVSHSSSDHPFLVPPATSRLRPGRGSTLATEPLSGGSDSHVYGEQPRDSSVDQSIRSSGNQTPSTTLPGRGARLAVLQDTHYSAPSQVAPLLFSHSTRMSVSPQPFKLPHPYSTSGIGPRNGEQTGPAVQGTRMSATTHGRDATQSPSLAQSSTTSFGSDFHTPRPAAMDTHMPLERQTSTPVHSLQGPRTQHDHRYQAGALTPGHVQLEHCSVSTPPRGAGISADGVQIAREDTSVNGLQDRNERSADNTDFMQSGFGRGTEQSRSEGIIDGHVSHSDGRHGQMNRPSRPVLVLRRDAPPPASAFQGQKSLSLPDPTSGSFAARRSDPRSQVTRDERSRGQRLHGETLWHESSQVATTNRSASLTVDDQRGTALNGSGALRSAFPGQNNQGRTANSPASERHSMQPLQAHPAGPARHSPNASVPPDSHCDRPESAPTLATVLSSLDRRQSASVCSSSPSTSSEPATSTPDPGSPHDDHLKHLRSQPRSASPALSSHHSRGSPPLSLDGLPLTRSFVQTSPYGSDNAVTPHPDVEPPGDGWPMQPAELPPSLSMSGTESAIMDMSPVGPNTQVLSGAETQREDERVRSTDEGDARAASHSSFSAESHQKASGFSNGLPVRSTKDEQSYDGCVSRDQPMSRSGGDRPLPTNDATERCRSADVSVDSARVPRLRLRSEDTSSDPSERKGVRLPTADAPVDAAHSVHGQGFSSNGKVDGGQRANEQRVSASEDDMAHHRPARSVRPDQEIREEQRESHQTAADASSHRLQIAKDQTSSVTGDVDDEECATLQQTEPLGEKQQQLRAQRSPRRLAPEQSTPGAASSGGVGTQPAERSMSRATRQRDFGALRSGSESMARDSRGGDQQTQPDGKSVAGAAMHRNAGASRSESGEVSHGDTTAGPTNSQATVSADDLPAQQGEFNS